MVAAIAHPLALWIAGVVMALVYLTLVVGTAIQGEWFLVVLTALILGAFGLVLFTVWAVGPQ